MNALLHPIKYTRRVITRSKAAKTVEVTIKTAHGATVTVSCPTDSADVVAAFDGLLKFPEYCAWRNEKQEQKISFEQFNEFTKA